MLLYCDTDKLRLLSSRRLAGILARELYPKGRLCQLYTLPGTLLD